MILSSRYLGAPGSTTLMAMLINIRPKPSASLPRRGRTNSISSGRTLRNVSVVFFLGLAGDTASSLQREPLPDECRYLRRALHRPPLLPSPAHRSALQ